MHLSLSFKVLQNRWQSIANFFLFKRTINLGKWVFISHICCVNSPSLRSKNVRFSPKTGWISLFLTFFGVTSRKSSKNRLQLTPATPKNVKNRCFSCFFMQIDSANWVNGFGGDSANWVNFLGSGKFQVRIQVNFQEKCRNISEFTWKSSKISGKFFLTKLNINQKIFQNFWISWINKVCNWKWQIQSWIIFIIN